MKPDKEKKLPNAVPQGAQSRLLLDTKQIAEAVVELNILRKNVQIYPLGHDQVQGSLDRAHQAVLKTLDVNSALTLGIANDTLMIGDDVLDPDNAVFKEFSVAMKLHDIAAVTFQNGVQEDELLQFFKVISRRPNETKAAGGIETEFSDVSLQHIAIREVDYSQFYLTDEVQTVKVASKDKAQDADQIWRDFISHFVSDTLSQSEQDISIEDLEKYSPVQLAQALNSGQVGNATALDTYDQIVSRHLRYTTSKKGSENEAQGRFSSLNLLLKELSPQLRRQFLSVTFNHCDSRRHIPEAETFLRGLSQDFVVDMLRQASGEGKEISPSLLSLVQKITNIEGIESGAPLIDPTGLPVQPSSEKLQHLFKREDHETFVVPEYEALLQQVAGASPTDLDAVFPLEECLETMKSPHLDIQIARVVIAFLEADISGDEYRDYADQLLAALPALINSGAFQILQIVFETLSRHQEEKSDADVRSAAEAVLAKMKAPELVTKAVRVFGRGQTSGDDNAQGFLLAMGAGIVPEAVSILANREVAVENDLLYPLLGHFRMEAIAEIKKRLNDTRFQVVSNMILLLQVMEAKGAADLLRPFLDHSDSILRMQALKTFLEFKDPEAVPQLRREIQSHRYELASKAIDWAGQYKIQAVVPDLLSKMKKFVIFRSDLHTNEKIINALGKIGDPASIDPLAKLVDRVFTLYRKQLVQMRRSLFKSMAGYPSTAAISLIKTGYRSKDKEIRSICRNIRKEFEAAADK